MPRSLDEALDTLQCRACASGLEYVTNFDGWIVRRRRGRGFTHHYATGGLVKAKHVVERINLLAVPPAWNEVLIARAKTAHIQATGNDDAGRRQYIYHPRWHALATIVKFEQLSHFAAVLPRIRRAVRRDLKRKRLDKHRVVAAVVRVMDRGRVRVGNKEYAVDHGARGATTLAEEHVEVRGKRVRLHFPGKSGQQRELTFADAELAKLIRRDLDDDYPYLFHYLDAKDQPHEVTSHDVNTYLRRFDATISAKDFRTWHGSVITLGELRSLPAEMSQRQRKSLIIKAIDTAAEGLGNTRAVCRSSYIHPGILKAAKAGVLNEIIQSAGEPKRREMTRDEALLETLMPLLAFDIDDLG